MSSARTGQRRGVASLVRAFDVCVVATTIRVERAWFERSISATTRALVREVVFAVEGKVVLREGIVGACSAAAVLYATATEQQRRGREREQLGGEPSHAPQSSATKSGVLEVLHGVAADQRRRLHNSTKFRVGVTAGRRNVHPRDTVHTTLRHRP